MQTTLLSVFLFSVFISFAQSNDKYQHLVDSLVPLERQDELITYFEKELIRYPKSEDVLRWLGIIHMSKGNWDLGEKYYKDALIINPECSRCYVRLGQIYFQKKDNEKAFQMFDKAILIEPNKAENYSDRAIYKEQIDHQFSALTDINKAIELDPKNSRYYMQRGEHYQKQGVISKALIDLSKSIELDPSDPFPHYKKASIYYEDNNLEKALLESDLAIELDSNKVEFYLGRGSVYSRMEEHEKAISDYKKAIEIDPKDCMTYYYCALEEYAMENMDGYCSNLHICYSMAKENEPKEGLIDDLNTKMTGICDSSLASYYYQRGIAWYNLKQYDNALAIYSQGLKKFPTNSMLLSFRGNAYLVIQNYKEALKDYYQAIQYQENVVKELENNPTYLTNESKILYQRGFTASIYISIAEANFALGEYEQALEQINKGIEIAPDIKEFGKENYYFMRGNIYVGMGKYKLAIEDFNLTIELNNESAPAYIERAVARVMSTTNETITSYLDQENSVPNWMFPVKMSVKKSDKNIVDALLDCNQAIIIEPNYAYFYYVRGQIKKMIGEDGYCYDLLRAREMGYSVEPDLIKYCPK